MKQADPQHIEQLLRQTLDHAVTTCAPTDDIDDETLALLATGQVDTIGDEERERVLNAVSSDLTLLQTVRDLSRAFEAEESDNASAKTNSSSRILFRFTGGAWLIAACLTLFLGLLEPATQTVVQTPPGTEKQTESQEQKIPKGGKDPSVGREGGDGERSSLEERSERSSTLESGQQTPLHHSESKQRLPDEQKNKTVLQESPAVASGSAMTPSQTGFYVSLGITVLLTLVLAGFTIRGSGDDSPSLYRSP